MSVAGGGRPKPLPWFECRFRAASTPAMCSHTLDYRGLSVNMARLRLTLGAMKVLGARLMRRSDRLGHAGEIAWKALAAVMLVDGTSGVLPSTPAPTHIWVFSPLPYGCDASPPALAVANPCAPWNPAGRR